MGNTIKKFVLGDNETNCYLVYLDKSKEAVIIDPGCSDNLLLEYIKLNKIKVKYILLTHGHFDHIQGIDMIKSINKSAKIYASYNEKNILLNPSLNLSGVFSSENTSISDYTRITSSGKLDINNFNIEVIFMPGHTLGGLAYYFKDEKILFSGDSIFYHSIGRTDFPTGDYNILINSVRNVLSMMDGDVLIYPGHGSETTVKEEKENNPYI